MESLAKVVKHLREQGFVVTQRRRSSTVDFVAPNGQTGAADARDLLAEVLSQNEKTEG